MMRTADPALARAETGPGVSLSERSPCVRVAAATVPQAPVRGLLAPADQGSSLSQSDQPGPMPWAASAARRTRPSGAGPPGRPDRRVGERARRPRCARPRAFGQRRVGPADPGDLAGRVHAGDRGAAGGRRRRRSRSAVMAQPSGDGQFESRGEAVADADGVGLDVVVGAGDRSPVASTRATVTALDAVARGRRPPPGRAGTGSGDAVDGATYPASSPALAAVPSNCQGRASQPLASREPGRPRARPPPRRR